MAAKQLNYPHPVLEEGNKDFPGCTFEMNLLSQDDSGENLTFDLSCVLDCAGLQRMLDDGSADAYLRIKCARTSYRNVKHIDSLANFEVQIEKQRIGGLVELQAVIVAAGESLQYRLPEFNRTYFGDMAFRLRKGDVLAIEPGMRVSLDSVLEREMAGIVQVTYDSKISDMRVHYAAIEDEDPDRSDYIYVILPKEEYKFYGQLRTKKHLRHGIERFLQCSLVLPAITEALSRLRYEEMVEEEDLERHYKGTVWADSLYASLRRLGIGDLSEEAASDYELANRLLGNVEADSINNLMQKLKEWSTIGEEDEAL